MQLDGVNTATLILSAIVDLEQLKLTPMLGSQRQVTSGLAANKKEKLCRKEFPKCLLLAKNVSCRT